MFPAAPVKEQHAFLHSGDLDAYIASCLDAIPSTSSPSHAPLFHLLGKALCSRATIKSSSLLELDQAIEYLHTAITSGHATSELLSSGMLADLASALHSRWHLHEQLDDLNASIHLRRLVLSHSSSETQIASITALATAVFLRFTHFLRTVDLNEVIDLNQRALYLSMNDASRFEGLCNMAQSLMVAWDYDGEMAHIESAIGLLREAVNIGQSLPEMLDYAISLNMLSEAIQSQLRLSEEDIDECVSLDTLALTFVPKGHRERPLTLAALATTILVRYTISFQSDDFALYHTLHEELESMLDAGHRDTDILADYWALTQNIEPYHSDRYALTSTFRQRLYILQAETLPEQEDVKAFYTRTLAPDVFLRRLVDPIGQESVLMGSFTLLKRVPTDEDRKVVRGNIAWKCRGKPYITVESDYLPSKGSIQDVEEEWLSFMPVQDDHPWASAFYYHLSQILLALEDNYGFEAVQRAQVYAHRALDVQQSHLPWRYQILSHLALLYILQAEKECESSEDGSTSLDALDQTLHYTELALATCPPHRRSDVQVYAVDAYVMKHKLLGDSASLSSAIEICRRCSLDPDIDVWDRYTFVERFVEIAKAFEVHLLEALLIHVDVSDDIVATHFTMPKVIEHVGELELSDAVATAAEHCFTIGEYEMALKVLEKGRGMLWARLAQLQAHRLKRKNQSENDMAQLELILEAAEEERSKAEKENTPWKRILNLSCRQRRLSDD